MTSPLDDALRRTADAVDRYQVPEHVISLAAASLVRMSAVQRAESGRVALVDAIVGAAAAHGGRHDDCEECAALANALAVAMGVVRAEVDVEFAERLGE